MKFGYTLLYVNNVVTTMKFYAKAFSLKPGFLHESNQYGEMETGGTKLGFVHHDTASEHGFRYQKITTEKSAPGIEIVFIADNVKKAYSKAIKAGAIPVSKPKLMPWGQTVSYVRDCNGMLIEICSAIH